MASSSSSSPKEFAYDVFLSFRGETRYGFTAHLHKEMRKYHIRTFLDDEELRAGSDLSTQFIEAIEQSRASVIVFSENYASQWCLNEVVKIMECARQQKQLVLPIFYRLQPSDVRYQKGKFGEGFAKCLERENNKDKVQNWRDVLKKIVDLSGFVVEGNEADCIDKFIKKQLIGVIKSHESIGVPRHLVGMDSRINDIKLLMSRISDNSVGKIMIYGMGGVGKTTLAKALYNSQKYEAWYFLENIRELSHQPGGTNLVQRKLLDGILRTEVKDDVAEIQMRKRALSLKRVLIVLDDLEDDYTLVGDGISFGSGSRIIITTRNTRLRDFVQLDSEYEMKGLDTPEALDLFHWHASQSNLPFEEDYGKLSHKIVKYCGGLPLALEVFGQHLRGRNIGQWEEVCAQLNSIAHHDRIKKCLIISFEGLQENQKSIFLDIACFFIGREKEHLSYMWNACDFGPEIALATLEEKCLITINESNKLRMHDVLRDMGRDIVCKESPKIPGQRSRLWEQKIINKVLKDQMGSEKIEAIVSPSYYERLEYDEKLDEISSETFRNMGRLRLLEMTGTRVRGRLDNMFRELTWFSWFCCPLECLPSSFHPESLVVLEVKHSNLEKLWKKDTKVLENLKVLDVSSSGQLRKTPDFSKVPKLERLILGTCSGLREIHSSIEHLSSLVELDLTQCYHLTSIQIDACLTSLKILKLGGVKCCNFKFKYFSSSPCLEYLDFSDCKLRDEDIPEVIGSTPSSLKYLDLSWNHSLRKLQADLTQLSNLTILDLSYFWALESLTELLPPNLQELRLRFCESLQQLPNLQGMKKLRQLDIRYCKNLATGPLIKSIHSELPTGLTIHLWNADINSRFNPHTSSIPFPPAKFESMTHKSQSSVVSVNKFDYYKSFIQIERNSSTQGCPGLEDKDFYIFWEKYLSKDQSEEEWFGVKLVYASNEASTGNSINEKLEMLLFVLQSSFLDDDGLIDDESLSSTLEQFGVQIWEEEELLLRVLRSPLIPGSNLVGIVNYVWKHNSDCIKSKAVVELLVRSICCQPPRLVNGDAFWDLLVRLIKRKKELFTTDILNGMILILETHVSAEERIYASKLYSFVVQGLCRNKDIDKARALLFNMIERGPPPCNVAFNAIINGLIEAGDMTEAVKTFELMKSRELTPDEYTYSVIICGYVKNSEIPAAQKVLVDARENVSAAYDVSSGLLCLKKFKDMYYIGKIREDMLPTNGDAYNKMMQSLFLIDSDWETADKCVKEMEDKGLHLNAMTRGLRTTLEELSCSSKKREFEGQ